MARATNDAVRDWNVSSGAVVWPRGLDTLGHSRSITSSKVAFWFDHLHPDDLPRIQESLKQAFQGKTDRWIADYRFRRRDGAYLAIRERALIVRSGRGTAERLVGVMTDVTQRLQLEAQFCRAQRMEAFGQLAGGLAHDFNNFLTTILGYSDLLLTQTRVKEPIASQIREIRDAAGRASRLTHQLLAFSRRQALEPAVLEVNSLITNLERSLLGLLGENIAVVCQLHQLKEGAYVRVDRDQFEQIIVNLALNARDAMSQGGCLTLTTSTLVVKAAVEARVSGFELSPGEYVAITVTDNGPGLSAAARARLFEPFFTTKDPARHSGLGLATSYGIVRQSGGQICAESDPGCGASFHILLPRVAAPPPAAYRRPARRKLPTGTETILVLEDEVGVRHLSVRALRSLGYQVLEAAHGKDAKRLIRKGGAPRIDLLLTDMVLPEMSGRDFADWLARTSPATKVIFISGYLEESLDPRDRREPGMRFLAKPFNAEQLATKVREVLDGR
ncbi:MAG TPA: ATP-binding protein [Chthoniobacterales bacterium]|nr:ATP-binding protein [Chthoniobacterales bacterium]